MAERTNILNELNDLNSSLGNISPVNVYSIPVGYFDTLIIEVLNRIKALETDDVKEELNHLSSTLSRISKQTPYSIPEGYFDKRIMPVQKPSSNSKIISLFKHNWLKVAAVFITVAIAFTTIKFLSTKSTGKDPVAGIRKDIKNLNQSQKENLIEFLDIGFDSTETAGLNKNNKANEFKELLKDIPEDELTDFEHQTEDMGSILLSNTN